MSTQRIQTARRTHVIWAEDGLPHCRWCGKKLAYKQVRYCPSTDGGKTRPCLHEWSIRSNVSYMRAEVLKRDKGVCAICRFDTEKTKRVLDHARRSLADLTGESWPNLAWFYRVVGDVLDAIGWDTRQTNWHADHIIPVSEGGGLCGLENIRTLCVPCHKEVTRELHRRKKERRLKGCS